MKALRLHGVGDMRLHDEPLPEPGPGESLLRVTAVGICGSDLHWFADAGIGDAKLSRPLVLGHEFAAVVESGPLKGQRVAVDPCIPCEECEWCLEGNPNLCPNHRFAGHGHDDGALRQYLAWPSRYLFPLPEAISDSEGAVLEAMGVAMHTFDLAHPKLGSTVGIFGCGPIGLLAIQLARLSGVAQIIATDILPHRLEAARAMGATHTFTASHGAEVAEIMAATHNRGVDVAIEIAGENDAVEAAIGAAKLGGRVVLAGIPADNRTSFTAATARRKGLTIKMVRRMKLVYPRAIRLVAQGLVDVRSVITREFSLEQYQTAFSVAERREGLKIVIKP